MSTVNLESWVRQQYGEVGWGRDGKGQFIGKTALKAHMIKQDPKNADRIRQIING